MFRKTFDHLNDSSGGTVLRGMSGMLTLEKTALVLAMFVFLWIVSRYNYLLFHVTAELFAVVVGCLIFVLATRTYKFSRNSYLLFLGNAYLAVALVDFFHILAFKGMGIFSSSDPNMATQLWIAARYLEAFALMLVPWLGARISGRSQFLGFIGIASFLIGIVMTTGIFPDCFSAVSGLTDFKIVSEFVISALLAAAMIHTWQIRESLTRVLYLSLMLSMGATILSEMAFTLYTDVYGVMNGLGHILKIVSFMFIYQGVVIKGLDEPYGEIFRRLQDASRRDPLTGLHNRLGFRVAAEHFFALSKRDGFSVGLIMMDIDNFKAVNDRFGHIEGDSVLKKVADLLVRCSRGSDITCRFGGDEFIILMKTDPDGLVSACRRVEDRFREFCDEDGEKYGIDLSVGSAIAAPGGQFFDLDRLIQEADEDMYRQKRSKR